MSGYTNNLLGFSKPRADYSSAGVLLLLPWQGPEKAVSIARLSISPISWPIIVTSSRLTIRLSAAPAISFRSPSSEVGGQSTQAVPGFFETIRETGFIRHNIQPPLEGAPNDGLDISDTGAPTCYTRRKTSAPTTTIPQPEVGLGQHRPERRSFFLHPSGPLLQYLLVAQLVERPVGSQGCVMWEGCGGQTISCSLVRFESRRADLTSS